MILKHYNNMLPDFLLKAMFFIGGIKILYEVIRQKRHISILLVVWALIPFTFIATRSMWIHKYHLFFVYPPVIIIAAYGSYVFIRYVIDKLCGQFLSIKWRAYIVIFLFSFAISIPQLKNINLYADAVTGEFGSPGIASRACDYIKQHYAGEVIIAPIGLAESYYLEKFVYDKAKVDAVERCFKLISDNSAWVFMGDNFFNNGKLDEFDRYVQENGKLIMRSNPVSGFTDKGNKAGYALYYIEKQPAFKNMHKYSIDY